MRHSFWIGLWTVALFGCDARVSEVYRGEPLLSMRGSLLFETQSAPSDLEPLLAFLPASGDDQFLLDDVDSRGDFPADFTFDVLSPPPADAMFAVDGLPSVALGFIAAAPADHPDRIAGHPGGVDGAGGFSWCENGNEDCYRRIEQCVAGTDNCYRELARCRRVMTPGKGVTGEICDEILEQSGDPTIANVWENFAGVSTNHFLVYVAGGSPAGSGRTYLERVDDDGNMAGEVALIFGNDPIPAGYHLIHARFANEQEQAADDACAEAMDAKVLKQFNQAHGTDHDSTDEIWAEAPDENYRDNPYVREVGAMLYDEMFATGCLTHGVRFKRLDPSAGPVVVTIGTRDLNPIY